MSWILTTIGEHCTVTSSKRFHVSDRSESGIPFYCSKQIIQSNHGEDVTDFDYIREEFYMDVAKRFGAPKENDLLVTTRGTIGVPYLYRSDDRFYFADGNLTWMKDFKQTLLPQYLYYWFLTDEGQKKIDAIAKGTAQKAVPIAGIKSLEIRLPPIVTQQSIANILVSYDKLIENNRKQIKLLEEAAQRLYKEWFVDLRFPGHETTPVTDGIPDGWTVYKIGERFETYLGGTPSRAKPQYWQDGTIPWINSSKVNELRVVEPSEYITTVALKESATKLLPTHTTLVAITGATLGQVSYTEIETCANQSVVGIVDPSGCFEEYIYCYVNDNIKQIISKATGGAQQHINKDIVNAFSIILPSDRMASSFKIQVAPLFDRIKDLLSQNILLSEARDRLLPKLMNGEIEV